MAEKTPSWFASKTASIARNTFGISKLEKALATVGDHPTEESVRAGLAICNNPDSIKTPEMKKNLRTRILFKALEIPNVNLKLIREIIDETNGGIDPGQTDDKGKSYVDIGVAHNNEEASTFISTYIRDEANKRMKALTNITTRIMNNSKRSNKDQHEIQLKKREESDRSACESLQKRYEEELEKQKQYNENPNLYKGIRRPFAFGPPGSYCDKYLKPSNKRRITVNNLRTRRNRTRKHRR